MTTDDSEIEVATVIPEALRTQLGAGNVCGLIELVITDNEISADRKIALINEIRKAKPPIQDRWLFRSVVWILGAAVLIATFYGFADLQQGQDVPDGLIALASTAVGALAGLIAPSSSSQG